MTRFEADEDPAEGTMFAVIVTAPALVLVKVARLITPVVFAGTV
jgi:Flp pilus assembly pilin Flp